jgi:DNA repair exonuclease SbcCD ATPase subunit
LLFELAGFIFSNTVCMKLSTAREEAVKEYKQKVIDLNAKLSRVYTGEEEQERRRLEERNEELVQENERLKQAHDNQRKRRKEAERLAQQAQAMAEEAVQEQLQEANDEGALSSLIPP